MSRGRGTGGRGRSRGLTIATDDALEGLRSHRTASSTKKLYYQKIQSMILWYQKNHPTEVNGLELILPLSKTSLMDFISSFSVAAQMRDRLTGPEELTNEPEAYVTSTMQGYKSAILDYYRTKGIQMAADINLELNSLIESKVKQTILVHFN